MDGLKKASFVWGDLQCTSILYSVQCAYSYSTLDDAKLLNY